LATDGSIQFLTLDEVLAIHQDQSPGAPSPDQRQLGQLRACLALPATKLGGGYTHRDIFEMAGAYLFHLVHHRPFGQGSRRVAVLASVFFLYLHDIELDADPKELVSLSREVAGNRASQRTVAEFFRVHARPSA